MPKQLISWSGFMDRNRSIAEISMTSSVRRSFVRFALLCGLAASLGGCLGYEGVITRGAIVD
ncbi:MAG: hypothetical protein N2444_07750, partial [Methylocystis sp.]|nr:hypothetical protein [Methylocystis sp.]